MDYHTFVDRLASIVARQPQKTAVTFLQDGETESGKWTYTQLQNRAKAIATELTRQGATGNRALLLYQPGVEFITAFLGCLYAGAIAVPAYPPRANRSIERLLAVVEDAEAKFALTTSDLADKISHKFESESEISLQFIATDAVAEDLSSGWQRPEIHSETLAFLQYTSGSTGKPKGVMVCHRNLLANSASINSCFEITPQQTIVSWLPPYHDMGLIGSILQPLYVGASLVMMPPVSFLQRPHRWLEAISRYGGTVAGGPNFAYDLCVAQVTEEQKAKLDLSCWKLAFSGAEPVRAGTIAKFSEYFANCGFKSPAFYPCYGMAESTLLITGGKKHSQPIFRDFNPQKLAENIAVDDDSAEKVTLVSSGTNVARQHLAIVNPDNLAQCSEGEIGEIWASSNSVAQGYWKKTELTQYAFAATLPNYPGAKFLRTGDLGFLKEGELFVTGRLKDLIIIRGRNYYPQDIEFTVDKAHEAINPGSGAAFAVEIDGAEKLIITYEVKRTYIRKLDTEAVTKAVRTAVLQNHELNPHAIVLLKTASVPKTSSGKIQRHACKAGYLAGTLKVVGESVSATSQDSKKQKTNGKKASSDLPENRFTVRKHSEIQQWLIARLAQKLGVSQQEIHPEEPFAVMGLDSVQAVRLSAELEDYLGKKLSPTVVYDYPNISSLAHYLSQGSVAVTTATPKATEDEIAIVGLGCRFPGANNPEEFWNLLIEGKSAIQKCDRWEGSQYGGFIADVDKFDPSFFGITPRETQRMDPQQRLLLEVSWEALENANIAPQSLAGSATGVFIGISSSDYNQLQHHYGTEIDAYGGTGNAHSIAANRLSYFLDLKGPSLAVDTACSSSLVAVHLAGESLHRGECETAIVGGVNLILSPELSETFAKAGMIAADGRCKTFDADADGYVRGEGCGVVILKTLSAAQRDGDNILGIIKGSAINQDGRSNGLTAPSSLSQQEVIRSALANAGVEAKDISAIEAHGTGTRLGDPIEVNSLKAVFQGDNPCYLASVKTNIGHLEAAAGIAGLIKTILSLQKNIVPPHLNFQRLNPHIDLKDTSLTIPTKAQPWETNKFRYVGVSSFGFGGTNAHVIVGSLGRKVAQKVISDRYNILTLSAKNESALRDLVTAYQKLSPDYSITDVCYSANTGRSHFSHRLAIATNSVNDLKEKLAQYAAGNKVSGIFQSSPQRKDAKIAWLFTGQGSQYPNMGKELYQTQPVFRTALQRCAEILQPYSGIDLLEVIYPSDSDSLQLHETRYTQPAIFALEYALAQMWLSFGIVPDVVMGHSVGEYVAATVAGVFSLEDGLRLIAERGKLMQALPNNGSMFAVLASQETVDSVIAPYPEVAIAALNGDRNMVISGENNALNEIIDKLDAEGIKTKQLTVSHGFHSPLMQPMLSEFHSIAQTIDYRLPKIELISNVTGQKITKEIATPQYWVDHIVAPVRFIQGVKELQQYSVFMEIGAKPVLLGMGRPVLESKATLCLPSLRPRYSDWSQVIKSLSSLYCQGISVNWRNFAAGTSPQKIQLPTYPFQRASYWLQKSTAKSASAHFNYRTAKTDCYKINWQENKNFDSLKPQWGSGQWLIIGSGETATQVVRELEKNRKSYLQLAKSNLTIPQQPIQGILYFVEQDSVQSSTQYDSALNLIQTLSKEGVVAPIWFVTRQAQAVTDEALSESSIVSSSFWGLSKVIAIEHPELHGGVVDLDLKVKEEAEFILAVATNKKADCIARRQGKVYEPRLVPAEVSSKGEKISNAGSYLITGGLGSLGIQVAQWLADKGAKHLVLLGRSQPPSALKAITNLQEQGIEVEVARIDITDYKAIAELIASLSVPLKGIVHAAGVLADGLLQNQTPEKFQQVLAPKVTGAWNLHASSLDCDLDFFVLFSSVASLIGSPGQSNYAVANAGLDAIAHYRRSLGLTALSINWGAWDNGGMATAKDFQREGIELIQPQQGMATLEELLGSNATQIGVMSIDWDKLAQSYPYLRESSFFSKLVTTQVKSTKVYDELLAKTSEAREAYLTDYLRDAIAAILQVDPAELSVTDSLLDLGMDSLMLMEAISKIKEDLQLMLYPREFYERPKIAALAAYIATEFTSNFDFEAQPLAVEEPSVLLRQGKRKIQHGKPKIEQPIAFVLSSPRSGSTLLRVMLAGHPDLVSPPELHLLPFNTMQERQEELNTSYLGEGLQRALIELKGIDSESAQKLVDELVAQNTDTAKVYRLLQELAGDRLLIDKSPTYASDINNLYAAEATFSNAKYIHLVRHPYAVVESFARMRMNKLLGVGDRNPSQLGEAIWTQSNQNTLDFAQTVDPERVLLVRYEELVAQPKAVMQGICEFLEIPFNEEVLKPYQGDRMTDGVTDSSMSIGDPNFLTRSTIDSQLANAWRDIELPNPLDYEARETAALLNYELPKEAELTSEIEHKMEEILVNIRGLRVCLCTWGPKEGPVVLCLHGILEQGAAWSEVAIRLAQKGYRVIAPDLRGHGKSDRVTQGGSYNLMDFLGDIDAIVEVVAGRAFTLVGHSLGSVVAAIFASVRPQLVKNLVLIETILPTEAKEEDTAQQLATHLDYLASPPQHPVFPNVEAAAERLRQTTPALSKSVAMMLAERITEPCEGGIRWRWEPLLRTRAGMSFNSIGRTRYLGLLKKIQAPITLVYGDRSNFNRPEDLNQQQSAMPNAEKVVIPGGHNLPLEAPSGIAKIISGAIALTSKLIP